MPGAVAPAPEGRIALLDADQPRLLLFALDQRRELLPEPPVALPSPARAAAAADLSGTGTLQLVTLSASGDGACLIGAGAPPRLRCVTFDGRGERLLAADVDNDRRTEILVFGRSMSGVQVLELSRTGEFSAGDRLFPDMSVSDLQAADLNGDRITDLVLLNWLREELVILYGIGRGVFTQELSVRLEAEPLHLVLSTRSRSRSFVVVLSQPRLRRLAVYEGMRTGAFTLRQSIPVAGELRTLGIADVTGDGVQDLLVGGTEVLAVARGLTASSFDVPLPLGPGRSLIGALALDVTGDGRPDLVTADRDTRRLLVLPASGTSADPRPPVYAAGGSPAGVAVQDVTGDGLPDLLVANRTTDNITLFPNAGDGVFRSQRSLAVPAGPEQLRFVSPRAGAPLVVAHTGADAVSVLRFRAEESDSTLSITTGARPFLVRTREAAGGGALEILVRYLRLRDNAVSLSLFEQITGGRFIERSVRPSVPGRIVALTAGDLTRNGLYDVVYAARNPRPGGFTIGAALSGESFDLRTVREILRLGDSTITDVGLLAARITSDDIPDLLVTASGPLPRLGVITGRGEGTFSDSLVWIADVVPLHDAALTVADADADGRNDIVLLDAGLRAVLALLQRPDGTFRAPLTLGPALDTRTFGLAQLGGGPALDLIVPHAGHGTVTVTLDAARR